MLIYGDPKFEGLLQPLRARLQRLAEHALDYPHDLDRLRALLILCGQLEQGAQDLAAQPQHAGKAIPWTGQLQLATTCAAEAFYSAAYRQPMGLPAPRVESGVALGALLRTLEDLRSAPDLRLTVKVPEGFGIYALYPEQYMVAAAHWAADHRPQRGQGVVVVGIRSIGTTLAAVVSAALRAHGWQVQSFTVRPAGHPYDRQVDISPGQISSAAFGLIVDEGPGISGSSMAATAGALVKAGLERRNIAFLPGHRHGPGGAGADEVQTWWRTTPCYVAETKHLSFAGRPLQEALASMLPRPVVHMEDFSGGQWRQAVYPDASRWPALCTAFERIKYRYTLQDGKRVLVKFLGLAGISSELASGAEAAATLLRQRAAQGVGAPVIGVGVGFVATEWVEGVPMAPGALPPERIDVLGAYIAHVAGPPMPHDERRHAAERLTEMLYANTCEAFGKEAAQRTQCYADSKPSPAHTYGDGHMQPYEWIDCGGHRLVKVDSVGHDCDHTLIGRQPVAWDVAGTVVEWGLDGKAGARLLKAFSAAGGAVDPGTLDFYRAAYLAFRLGQCSLAAQVHDPGERARLMYAAAHYRHLLAKCLDSMLAA